MRTDAVAGDEEGGGVAGARRGRRAHGGGTAGELGVARVGDRLARLDGAQHVPRVHQEVARALAHGDAARSRARSPSW